MSLTVFGENSLQGAIAVFLINLGLGQLSSTYWRLRGASLVGPSRWAGYGLGAGLLASGALLLPQTLYVLLWTPLAGLLSMLLLLWAGSTIKPPPHPDTLFVPEHPAHGGCDYVQIPDDDGVTPGLLLKPPDWAAASGQGAAVCLLHGSGDTKTSYKWRLARTLLNEGLIVLTIDLPGHGDNRHRPLKYPDSLTAILAAIRFLQARPEVKRIGLVGISLGGAMAIKAIAPAYAEGISLVDALVIFSTPVRLNYTNWLFYREAWTTCARSPLLSLLRETTIKQLRDSWYAGGYRSSHNTTELFELLKPLDHIRALKALPILLVYSQSDRVAPPDQAEAMRRAAPHADFIVSKKASHVALTLMPEINIQVAAWLRKRLSQ
jgi:alpha-beta hydrolase superfamily lysophospholipase